tara:strand:+ start:144 stop:965 length:822 start_codon:yes stop_codon:yes gene_type:complete
MSKRFFTTEISESKFENNHLRYVTVKSNNLGGRGDMTIFVPKGLEKTHGDIPIVTLLHGVYGSHWAWTMKAGVHWIAQRMIDMAEIAPMCIVMPSDGLFYDGSGYLKHQEKNFESWITEDVLDATRELISCVSDRSPAFIAGLSMGGYGALRLGAKYPQRYEGFSGLSSITKFREIESFYEKDTFGKLDNQVPEPESVLEIIIANRATLKPFRFDCGKDDSLFQSNKELSLALKSHGISHQFEANEGKHEWVYWENNIGKTLQFFHELASKAN